MFDRFGIRTRKRSFHNFYILFFKILAHFSSSMDKSLVLREDITPFVNSKEITIQMSSARAYF